MKSFYRKISFLLLISLAFWSCAGSGGVKKGGPQLSLQELVKQMPAENAVQGKLLNSALLNFGDAGIQQICGMLRPFKIDGDSLARFAINGLAVYVSQPGHEDQRKDFSQSILTALERTTDREVKSFLMSQLHLVGGDETVVVLKKYLSSEKLCEPATQALLAIHPAKAEDVLLQALATAGGENRVTLVKALGDLRSAKAVPVLLELTSEKNAGVRDAAIYALANIGVPAGKEPISRAAFAAKGFEREKLLSEYLRFAKRLSENGNPALSSEICRELIHSQLAENENHLKSVALAILSETEGEGAIAELVTALDSKDLVYREAVLKLAGKMPGGNATLRWVKELKNASPEKQSGIIKMLGVRGDEAALPAVLDALKNREPEVRIAAVKSAVCLNDRKAIPAVLGLLNNSENSAEIEAVREALVLLPGKKVLVAIADDLGRMSGPAQEMAVQLLAGRNAVSQRGKILRLVSSPNQKVRSAAIRAFAELSTGSDYQTVVGFYLNSKNSREQTALLKTISRISRQISNENERIQSLEAALPGADSQGKKKILRALSRIRGEKAFRLVEAEVNDPDVEISNAAVRSLGDWPGDLALKPLLQIVENPGDLTRKVLAFRGCLRILNADQNMTAPRKITYYRKLIQEAPRTAEKRLVLGSLGKLKDRTALRFAVEYLGDDSLANDAAQTVFTIAASAEEGSSRLTYSDVLENLIASRLDAAGQRKLKERLEAGRRMNRPPKGFTALFNGSDLDGWKGLVANPVKRAKMSSEELAAAQKKADSVMFAHWKVHNGVLVFDGEGQSLCTVKDYGDFELLVDWKIEKKGDSGIYLRGSPQVQIWDPAQWPEGSGGLYNNKKNPGKPQQRADNPIGEWNTFRIKMVGDKVTVYLNDILVVNNVTMENYWERDKPIYSTGQIELQSHHSRLYFRNIFIREIPGKKSQLNKALFNGKDLTGWERVGGKEGSWNVENGILYTEGGGGGWLSTKEQYADFKLQLDFRVPPGGNSGVFIRAPQRGDPAYTGMEIQVLDDYAAKYAKLEPWQYTGSIYKVQAPSSRKTRQAGEWQTMEITCKGPKVRVTLNGSQIISTNLIDHMDKERSHPGIKRRKGYIGLQNHSTRVEYRNIRLTEF